MAALLTFSLGTYRSPGAAVKGAHWWSVINPGLTTSSLYTVPEKEYLLLSETRNQHNCCILEILTLLLEREQVVPPGRFVTQPDYFSRLKIYSPYVITDEKQAIDKKERLRYSTKMSGNEAGLFFLILNARSPEKGCKALRKWERQPIKSSIYSALADFLFRFLTGENRGRENFMSGMTESSLTCDVSVVFL